MHQDPKANPVSGFQALGFFLGTALIMLSVVWDVRVHAQHVNGIFYPRSSEDFFQEGRERLDEEILILQNANVRFPELVISELSPFQPDNNLEQEADRLIITPLNEPTLMNDDHELN